MWSVMTNRLPSVRTVAYAESHDQALVGDKTIAFRLMDKEMYYAMDRASQSIVVDRGMALHKMIRLMTISTGGEAYLNFMGNEFGHPEWIDFPREGNGWGYKYARRQWSLVDSEELKYKFLQAWDNAMIELVSDIYNFQALPVRDLWKKDDDQVLAFMRGDYVFVFNFNPAKSFDGYGILAPGGSYETVLSSDNPDFGGYDNIDVTTEHLTIHDPLYAPAGVEWLKLYLPSRTAIVLRKK